MSLTLTITNIYLPPNITTPITASLYYKQFYASAWTLIEANVPINLDGSITVSPPPHITIDPSQEYMLRAVDDLCGSYFDQDVILAPYCPAGYALSADGTYCYKRVISSAIPPSSPGNSVGATNISYSTCGSYIYAPGFSPTLGTGISAQIPTSNAFWVNGAGLCADNSTSLGPLNRTGLWASTTTGPQTVGFSICINIPIATTYYIGMGNDNYGSVYLDGSPILVQNETALNTQYSNGGACFKVWHIYPITIPAGSHVLELIGNNVSGPAALGFEIYNNTSAQIIAATAYTGLNLIFSTKDYIGMPVQIGSGGIGYSCADPLAALQYCSSPIECVRTYTTPILW